MDWKRRKEEVSLPKRVILVILQLVCAAAVGVSAIGLIYCLENDVFTQKTSANVYFDTEDCAEQSYYQFVNSFYGEENENQFMLDGELNLNQTVDITKLAEGISCKDKDPATTYTLKQLCSIYESVQLVSWLDTLEENSVSTLYQTEYEETYQAEYDENMAYSDEAYLDSDTWTAEQMAESREAFMEMLKGLDQPELLQRVYSDEFIYMYNHADEVEIELPESGERLADYALKNTEVSLVELYKQLREAELAIGEFRDEVKNGIVDDEKEFRSTINTMYYLQDIENDKIYTNVDEWKDLNYKDVLDSLNEDQVHAMYTYQWRDGGRTNAIVGNSAFGTNLSKYLGREGECYASDTENVLVLLDTNLPYKDVIAEQSQVYVPMTNFAKIFPVILAAAAIGCVVTTIFFCMWMGRRRYVSDETGEYFEDERPLAKAPMELLIVIDIVLIVIMLGLSVLVSDVTMNMDYVGLMVGAGSWCVGLAVVVDVILFPLLVKGKTKSWMTNGLCVMIFRSIRNNVRKAYENRKITQKLTIVFLIIFVIELIILGVMAATWTYGFGIFLFIVLNVAIYLFLVRILVARQRLIDGIDEIAGGNLDYQIDTTNMVSDDRHMAERMNNVREGMQNAIQEQMKSERLRTDLITNVSHDIKTPLTSIINYVDLLKREDVQDEKMAGYIDVLDRKSQRLKQLTEDLVEASKISSGNITLEMERIDLKQLIKQISGEFEEKFEKRKLTAVMDLPEIPMFIMADGRRMCRVIENLYNNAAKYAMPGSRVYVTGSVRGDEVTFSMKNMSEYPLNISADDLMERFVRGDVSRTTEGSGLGLEIARNLTVMQKGSFDLYLDGDLFKVTIEFEAAK